MEKYTFPAVILAGGKSSRMGEDKSLLPFENYSTLCEYQYTKLTTIFKNVYISTKEDKFEFIHNKNQILLENSSIYSPMVGLENIFRQLDNSPYIFIIAVDTPLVETSTIQSLIEHFFSSKNNIVIAKDTTGKVHNLCGMFHSNIHKDIQMLLKKDIHKIDTLIKNTTYSILEFEQSEQFTNLNTPSDYQKLLNK